MKRTLMTLVGASLLALPNSLFADVQLWRDRPSEALLEVLPHLSADGHYAWHVDGIYDSLTRELPVVEGSVEEVLQEYATDIGAEVTQKGRLVWIHPKVEGDMGALEKEVFSGDAEVMGHGIEKALAKRTPASLGILVKAWGTADRVNMAAAGEAVGAFLGLTPDEISKPSEGIFALMGHLEVPEQKVAPFGSLGDGRPAPWAALRLALLSDPKAMAAMKEIADNRGQKISAEPLAMVGAICALHEPTLEKLKIWLEDPAAFAKEAPYAAKKRRWGPKVFAGWMDQAVKLFKGEVPERMGPGHKLAEVVTKLKPEQLSAQAKRIDKSVKKVLKEHNYRGVGNPIEVWGEGPISTLTDLAVSSAHPQIRLTALGILGDTRSPILVEPLKKLVLEDEDPAIVKASTLTLAKSRLPGAIAFLRETLKDGKDVALRRSAAEALTRARDPEVMGLLLGRIEAIGNSRDAEQQFCLQLLGASRNPDAMAKLEAFLQGQDPLNRMGAVVALTTSDDPAAKKKLVDVLINPEASAKMKELAMRAFLPTHAGMIDGCYDALMSLNASKDRPVSLLPSIVEGLQRCAAGLASGDHRLKVIGQQALAWLNDGAIPTVVKKKVLATFQYLPVDEAMEKELKTRRDTSKNRMMVLFYNEALKKAGVTP